MSACVSPPHDSVSHIVHAAAIIAAAASTALPPRSKIIAPAVAASGLPVTAIQCRPCSGGFCVRCANAETAASRAKVMTTKRRMPSCYCARRRVLVVAHAQGETELGRPMLVEVVVLAHCEIRVDV